MADHLFGDLFDPKAVEKTKPGEHHLFGDMFPAEVPKDPQRGADIAKIAKVILLGSPGRMAYDKGYREEVAKEIGPLLQKYGVEIPEPFTEKPILPEIAGSIGRGMTAPGRAVQGGYRVTPEQPGVWSEADQFRQNQLDDQMAKDATAAAGIVATGAIPQVLRAGASSIPFLNSGTSPGVAQLARTAIEKYGYPVRPGQMSDNAMVRRIDSILERMPFSGYRNISERQQQAINRGVTRQIGEESDTFNAGVMDTARRNRSREYNRLFESEVAQPDAQFVGRVRQLLNGAEEAVDTEGKMRTLSNAVRNILDKIGTDGTISGRAYQGLRADGSTLRILEKNQDPAVAYAARGIRQELDSLFRRSVSDENRDTLARLDRQWAIMKQIEPLVKKAEANGGNVAPADLMSAISAGRAGRERVAYGRSGDMGELAAIGQAFKPMSTSGTAENQQVFNLMTQLLANPFTLGGGGAAVGSMIGGLPAMIGGGAAGALGTRALGNFMASPSRAENMILRALGERGAVGQELPNVGAVPFVPALENLRDDPWTITVRPAQLPPS